MSTRALGFFMVVGGRFDTKRFAGVIVVSMPDAFGMFTGRTQSGELFRFGVEQITSWEGGYVSPAPYPTPDDV